VKISVVVDELEFLVGRATDWRDPNRRAPAAVVLAFAAAAAWFAYDTSSRGGYILAAGLVITAFLIPHHGRGSQHQSAVRCGRVGPSITSDLKPAPLWAIVPSRFRGSSVDRDHHCNRSIWRQMGLTCSK